MPETYWNGLPTSLRARTLLRAALAKPERDVAVADVKPDAMAAFEQTLREHKRVLDALAEYDAEPERDEEGR